MKVVIFDECMSYNDNEGGPAGVFTGTFNPQERVYAAAYYNIQHSKCPPLILNRGFNCITVMVVVVVIELLT